MIAQSGLPTPPPLHPPPSPPTFCERCRGLFATHGIRTVHTELSDSGIDFGRLTARSCIIHDCRFSPGEAPTAHIHTDMHAVPIHSTTPEPCPHPHLNTQSPARLDPRCACSCPVRVAPSSLHVVARSLTMPILLTRPTCPSPHPTPRERPVPVHARRGGWRVPLRRCGVQPGDEHRSGVPARAAPQ